MAMQFEYDETGSTFYYFMLAFLLIVFIPLTYIIWPFYKDPRSTRRTVPCTCALCLRKTEILLLKRKNTFSKLLKLGVILLGWSAVAFFAYKASTTENTHVEYNPFTILGIDPGATTREIKKAYKSLSLVHHPDKGGDEELFVQINKAYQALTDDVTRENWINHGNPDGPQAMQFGIALPSWIVDKSNSVWVLGLYMVVFMLALPTVVGTWWYRSIRYSADDILLNTSQLFFNIFAKNSLHNISKSIMILCSAFEFEKSNNKEVKERPTDNIQIPLLMKECRQLHDKTPLYPFRCPYSVKARTLFHSYLNRSEKLCEDNLLDIALIVKKLPALISETLNVCFQLTYFSKRQKNVAAPNVQTFENLIKINAMTIQATWHNMSPLLQLPHFQPDMIRYFATKRSNVKTLLQFAQLTEADRRSRLRMLGDQEYDNMMRVLWTMPYIDMVVKSEVLDDEQNMTISACSIVTVTCFLDRKSLRDVVDTVEVEQQQPIVSLKEEEEEPTKKKTWQKPQKKQKTVQKKKKVAPKKKVKNEDNKENESNDGKPEAEEEDLTKGDEDDGDDEKEDTEDEGEPPELEESDDGGSSGDSDDEIQDTEQADDEEWRDLQQQMSKKTQLSREEAESHPVHCPYFPVYKEEGWWVFIADRKTGEVITPPKYVMGLKDTQEVILKFQAPETLGHHKYNVMLKSDCYLNCEKEVLLKLLVEREIATRAVKQWDNISDSDQSESSVTESSESESEDQ